MHSFHFFKSDHSAPNHRKSNLSKNSDFCTSEFNLCGQSFLKDCTPEFKGTWHNNNIKVVVDAIYYICLNEILQRPLVKIELEILALQTFIYSGRMFLKNCTALQNSLRLGTIIMWIKAAQLLRDRYIFYTDVTYSSHVRYPDLWISFKVLRESFIPLFQKHSIFIYSVLYIYDTFSRH